MEVNLFFVVWWFYLSSTSRSSSLFVRNFTRYALISWRGSVNVREKNQMGFQRLCSWNARRCWKKALTVKNVKTFTVLAEANKPFRLPLSLVVKEKVWLRITPLFVIEILELLLTLMRVKTTTTERVFVLPPASPIKIGEVAWWCCHMDWMRTRTRRGHLPYVSGVITCFWAGMDKQYGATSY